MDRLDRGEKSIEDFSESIARTRSLVDEFEKTHVAEDKSEKGKGLPVMPQDGVLKSKT